jgi:hypothetical protein
MRAGGTEDKEHAMSQKLDTSPAVIGIDIGKNYLKQTALSGPRCCGTRTNEEAAN